MKVNLRKDHNKMFSPKNVKELQTIFVQDSKTKYVIQSQGKNWGYTVYSENDVIIDLSSLNNILDYNETLGYVVIEPGVTFEQLHNFLIENKSSFTITATGGPSNGSVIATTMERGIGKGINADLFQNCCALEVVLPNGKIIHSGFASLKDAKATHIHKHGIGPSFDSLFSQSRYGVITKMTLWLYRRPEFYSFFAFTLKEKKDIQSGIDLIRDMKQRGIITENFMIANSYKFIAHQRQYPWHKTDKTPLSHELRDMLARQVGLKGYWAGQNIITAPNKKILHAYENTISDMLSDIVFQYELVTKKDLDYMSDVVANKGEGKKIINDYHIALSLLNESVFLGYPQKKIEKLMYWRKKDPPSKNANPIKDKCGLYWVNSVVPMIGLDALNVTNIVEEEFIKGGFEPIIGLNMLSDKTVYLIASIVYDKEIEEEDQKAFRCYKETYRVLAANGYYAYRGANLIKELNISQVDDSVEILKNIGNVFDPEHLLSD